MINLNNKLLENPPRLHTSAMQEQIHAFTRNYRAT